MVRRMMKERVCVGMCEALTFAAVGRPASSAPGGTRCGSTSQRDLVRASLLLVPDRPKTSAG